jgi:hypothetical protein
LRTRSHAGPMHSTIDSSETSTASVRLN